MEIEINKKTLIVLAMAGILLIGVIYPLAQMLLRLGAGGMTNSMAPTGGETYSQMMARMHPEQVGQSNDMSGHHG